MRTDSWSIGPIFASADVGFLNLLSLNRLAEAFRESILMLAK